MIKTLLAFSMLFFVSVELYANPCMFTMRSVSDVFGPPDAVSESSSDGTNKTTWAYNDLKVYYYFEWGGSLNGCIKSDKPFWSASLERDALKSKATFSQIVTFPCTTLMKEIRDNYGDPPRVENTRDDAYGVNSVSWFYSLEGYKKTFKWDDGSDECIMKSDTTPIVPLSIAAITQRAKVLSKTHPGWSMKICRVIVQKKVSIGMNPKQVTTSWGSPDHINKSISQWGIREQWVYGNEYLYFEDEKLTSIQTSQ